MFDRHTRKNKLMAQLKQLEETAALRDLKLSDNLKLDLNTLIKELDNIEQKVVNIVSTSSEAQKLTLEAVTTSVTDQLSTGIRNTKLKISQTIDLILQEIKTQAEECATSLAKSSKPLVDARQNYLNEQHTLMTMAKAELDPLFDNYRKSISALVPEDSLYKNIVATFTEKAFLSEQVRAAVQSSYEGSQRSLKETLEGIKSIRQFRTSGELKNIREPFVKFNRLLNTDEPVKFLEKTLLAKAQELIKQTLANTPIASLGNIEAKMLGRCKALSYIISGDEQQKKQFLENFVKNEVLLISTSQSKQKMKQVDFFITNKADALLRIKRSDAFDVQTLANRENHLINAKTFFDGQEINSEADRAQILQLARGNLDNLWRELVNDLFTGFCAKHSIKQDEMVQYLEDKFNKFAAKLSEKTLSKDDLMLAYNTLLKLVTPLFDLAKETQYLQSMIDNGKFTVIANLKKLEEQFQLLEEQFSHKVIIISEEKALSQPRSPSTSSITPPVTSPNAITSKSRSKNPSPDITSTTSKSPTITLESPASPIDESSRQHYNPFGEDYAFAPAPAKLTQEEAAQIEKDAKESKITPLPEIALARTDEIDNNWEIFDQERRERRWAGMQVLGGTRQKTQQEQQEEAIRLQHFIHEVTNPGHNKEEDQKVNSNNIGFPNNGIPTISVRTSLDQKAEDIPALDTSLSGGEIQTPTQTTPELESKSISYLTGDDEEEQQNNKNYSEEILATIRIDELKEASDSLILKISTLKQSDIKNHADSEQVNFQVAILEALLHDNLTKLAELQKNKLQDEIEKKYQPDKDKIERGVRIQEAAFRLRSLSERKQTLSDREEYRQLKTRVFDTLKPLTKPRTRSLISLFSKKSINELETEKFVMHIANQLKEEVESIIKDKESIKSKIAKLKIIEPTLNNLIKQKKDGILFSNASDEIVKSEEEPKDPSTWSRY